MVNSAKFAERLLKVMEEYELNATAFADKIEVGRSSISHILSGRNKPSLEFVMKVVETFPEVELYWLLNGKGSLPPVKNNAENTSDLFSKSGDANASQKPQHTPIKNQEDYSSYMSPKSFGDDYPRSKGIKRIVIFYDDGTFESFEDQLPYMDL
tara:strand:- start:152 stop:613 length:462 start_codon:yes stop_codon:yes gene_type:complete